MNCIRRRNIQYIIACNVILQLLKKTDMIQNLILITMITYTIARVINCTQKRNIQYIIYYPTLTQKITLSNSKSQ